MTEQLVQTLVSYLPPAVARSVYADPRPLQQPHADRFLAAVLLCDISGFTALTEKLALFGAAGAEELIQILNAYFSRMIGILESEGGEVVQFSGDALAAVFPTNTEQPHLSPRQLPLAMMVRRAWQAAIQMQAAMSEFATLQTSAGEVALGMKIVIGAGTVLAFSVGGVFQRWQYIIAGDPLRQVAEAEHIALRGEIRLSPEAEELFFETALAPKPLFRPTSPEITPALLDALRNHIPGAITHRLMAGQSEWLAELRRMSVLFIGVNGLQADSTESLAAAHASMLAFQETVYRYEGSINKMLVDDKGAICIVLFGAPPLAHLDDPLRAVRCAIDLQQAATGLELRLAIGITTGQVFAGPVGSPSRREYTVMGDAVNLSARLMQAAGLGGIRADQTTYHATRHEVEWQILAPQHVKGKTEAVAVFAPLSLQESISNQLQQRLVGRGAELALADQMLQALSDGQMRIYCLTGGAGLGKSVVLQEIDRLGRERRMFQLEGNGQATSQRAAYRAWSAIFQAYFDIERLTSLAARHAQVQSRLAAIGDPTLLTRAPLLNDLLEMSLAETDLTSHLEPEQRRIGLATLLIDLLRMRAATKPLLLIIDDAHWLDSVAWELILQVGRELADSPILLVLATRSLSETVPNHPIHQIVALPHTTTREIAPLDDQDAAILAALALEVHDLPAELVAQIQHRAAGNPFVITEIARHLRDTGAVTIEHGQCILHDIEALEQIPDTVQGLVLSRIDRLPVDQQLTVKVASVIGPAFGSAALAEIHPGPQQPPEIYRHIDQLVLRDFLHRLPAPGMLFSHEFQNAIFQEVPYSTLLSTQRRQLHERLALWYEQNLKDQPGIYPLLAHHWRYANQTAKELPYTILAAKQLASEYANQEALAYLERALELAEQPTQRYELYWQQLQLHERVGNTTARRLDLEQLELLAKQIGNQGLMAQTWNAWADLYRDISDYPAALEALSHSLQLARQIEDRFREARSLTIYGQIMEYQGNFDQAQRYFSAALAIYCEIKHRRGEADNLSHLGNIAYYQGNQHSAYRYDQQSLAIRREIGDRAKESISLGNLSQTALVLGEQQAAEEYANQALAIAKAIGDRSGEAISLSMLGDILFVAGNLSGALQHYTQAVRLFHAKGERRREANTLNMLGQVWRDAGDLTQAQSCFEQALQTQRDIGDLSQAAYTAGNLAYILSQTSAETAEIHFDQAIALAQQTGNRDAEACARSYRAQMYEQLNILEQAKSDYLVALQIRSELEAVTAIEDRAGLARIALIEGDLSSASEQIEQCLSHIEQHGTAGMEFPIGVLLACYDLLQAISDTRATTVITSAYELLQRRAAATSDIAMREQMLHIPANQRVLSEARWLAIQSEV